MERLTEGKMKESGEYEPAGGRVRWITKRGGQKAICQVSTRELEEGKTDRGEVEKGSGGRIECGGCEQDRQRLWVADNKNAPEMGMISLPAGKFLSSTSTAPRGKKMRPN